MARVVVTGGAGFLGSHLTRALLERGDEVVVVDNLITGRTENLDQFAGRHGWSFVEHDVSRFVDVPGPVDVVMHLASPASPADFERIPIQILKVGGPGTHHTLGLARAKGARYFLASTSEVYGDPLVHPQPETYWGNVNPIGPRGVYDEAKRYAEAMTTAYHRHHGIDIRIARIFNSILADEQVLYDDGRELRRERIGDLAERLGGSCELRGYRVPAFDRDGHVDAAACSALVGHPPAGPCFEVTTRYGRSIKVTGDHSLFVEGPDGGPQARTVSELAVGDRIAIAGRIDVPVRDREHIDVIDAWDRTGGDPWELQLSWPGLGWEVWEHRFELMGMRRARRPDRSRQTLWSQVIRDRDYDQLALAEVRRLGLEIPYELTGVRLRTSGRSPFLPARVPITDEVLWVIGLWVAEGHAHLSDQNAFLTFCSGTEELERAGKVFERDFALHVVKVPAKSGKAPAVYVHSRLLHRLWGDLGFAENRKRIPGWILGLPLERLGWFLDGYRAGDGVHSGKKFEEGVRHEFSTVSDELKDDLVVAFARYGLVPSVGRYDTTLRRRTGDRRYPFWRLTLASVNPWSPLEWHRGVQQRLQARRSGDLVWARVRSITEIEPTELVYDFCVPGRENFWAGTGVMAHNTYGPSMRPDDGRAVSNFLVQAILGKPITIYGDGTQTRSFTYVEDEIRGFLALLDSDVTTPVNLGNPDEFTIRQLADLVLEVTGSTSELVFEPLPQDDPTQRQPDITKARELLDWSPTIDLRNGLERTAEWFRERLAR